MRLLFCTMLAATSVLASWACTNIIVGKKASVDGSVLVSYSADSYGCYGVMQHFAPGCHPQGSVRPVYDWETNAYKGTIPEAPDTTGLLDYGSLIYIALQRSRTAREAIDVMTSLVEEYGYCSEGETFTLADPQEAWIMEMVGKGPGVKGAVWVAVRIPDDCVCAHANQSRIHRFMHYDKKECLFAKDVVSFARSKGLYKGKDKDFDFAATYCPIDFSGARACEARVWGFYRLCVDGMDRYFEYASGKDLTATPMDLFYRPNKQLSVQDVQAAMRDQYEGTPLDMTHDAGAGVYQSPYRPRPLFWEHEGKKYFNERTQQSSFTFVAQMRASLPDAIGGVLWFANDDSKTSAYTPVYCCVDTIPACYTKTSGDDVSFSFKSAFWMCNWVANMVYPRFSLLYPDLEKRRTALEKSFFNQQQEVEAKALQLYGQDSKKAVAYLTDYSTAMADRMMEEWMQLAQFLIVKYNDNVVKPETDGVFLRTKDGLGAKVQSVGYPKATYERIIKETDDRFLVPTAQ